jgi:hypothetical protein
MPDETIRRDERLLCGRLVALPSTGGDLLKSFSENAGFQNIISIDFPAMPDVVELARTADYKVNYNMVLPDGIHQYTGTKPLEIPISFKLHAFDKQYCKHGARTLLQLAARLHSFVLPISSFDKNASISARVPETGETSGKSNDAQQQAAASQETVWEVSGTGNKNGAIFSPITCFLHLMYIGANDPGISAIGYVRDVNVKLSGPWLRGPDNSFNLPSSAEYSFTFVHRPNHNNSTSYTSSQNPVSIAEGGQAYADTVKDRLFNTRDLVQAANYQGFTSNPEGRTS